MISYLRRVAFTAALAAIASPAFTQTTKEGVVTSVARDRIWIVPGGSFSKADTVTINEPDKTNARWSDIHPQQQVRLSLDSSGKVVAVDVNTPVRRAQRGPRTGTPPSTGQRSEQAVTDLRPVLGGFASGRDVVVNGRVFPMAATMNVPGKAVLSNDRDYRTFEATVGFREGRFSGEVQFQVMGDGRQIYVSPWLHQQDPAIHIVVPVQGFSGITLQVAGANRGDYGFNSAVWANPILVSYSTPVNSASNSGGGPTSTPARGGDATGSDTTSVPPETGGIVSPPQSSPNSNDVPNPRVPTISIPMSGSTVSGRIEIQWTEVPGASAFLIEIQALRLIDPADSWNANRFKVVQVPGQSQSYTLDGGSLPKGTWHVRVSSLSTTGFMGVPRQWRAFRIE